MNAEQDYQEGRPQSGKHLINDRVGYFEKDIKYDKSFYTNSCIDILQILGALILFYGIYGIIFWGNLEFASAKSVEFMWTSVGLIIACCVWVLFTVATGAYTNRILKKAEFFQELIMEKEAKLEEQRAKDQ